MTSGSTPSANLNVCRTRCGGSNLVPTYPVEIADDLVELAADVDRRMQRGGRG